MASKPLLLSYVFIVLFQILHVFEEIACHIYEAEVARRHMNRNRYLIAASALSTLTIVPLALLLYDLSRGTTSGFLPRASSASRRASSTSPAFCGHAPCAGAWARASIQRSR
jgi:hypothetical protein